MSRLDHRGAPMRTGELTDTTLLDPHPFLDEMSNIGPVRLSFDDPRVGVSSVFSPRSEYEQQFNPYRTGRAKGTDYTCRHCLELLKEQAR